MRKLCDTPFLPPSSSSQACQNGVVCGGWSRLQEDWSEDPKFKSRGGTPSTTPSPHWEVVLGVLHMVRWGKVRTREERCSGIVLRNLQHSRSGVPYTCCNCFACAPLVSCNERTHMFDLRRSWSSARIRSMEHIDNGQKFCVRQSTWDTGFAGPGQKCLRRWSCVTNPFDWRLGRIKECILNGSVFHVFVATLLTQRGAVAETSSLSPTRSQRRRRLLARMWPQEWNLQCRWGVPDCHALVLQTR